MGRLRLIGGASGAKAARAGATIHQPGPGAALADFTRRVDIPRDPPDNPAMIGRLRERLPGG